MKKELAYFGLVFFMLFSCVEKEYIIDETLLEINVELENKILSLSNKVVVLEEEILALEKNTELENLEQIKQLLVLNKKLTALSDEVSAFKETNSNLEGENTELEQANSDLEGQNTELEETNSEVERKNAELEAEIADRISEIETYLAEVATKLEDLERDNSLYSYNLIKVHDFYNEELTHSQIIENALEFSSSIQDRVLLFDTVDWHIDRAIQLPSNTTVLIDGVTIKQNDLVFDNVFRGDNLILDPDDPNGFPLKINTLENIKILGINDAKIIGCDVNTSIYNDYLEVFEEAVGDYYGWRTLQISLTNCVGIEISGISFSQTRSWCISIDKSKDIEIHDLEINSNVKNGMV